MAQYLWFTKLLRDCTREGISRYATALSSAIAAWEGVATAAEVNDPLQRWCSPMADGTFKDVQMVPCRIGTSDPICEWFLALIYAGAPRIMGAFVADELLDDSASHWRAYGDHLLESSVADTASHIDGLDELVVRGFESSIYLVTRLKAIKRSGSKHYSISETSPAEALIRAVEEVLNGGLLSPEILTISLKRRKMRQFLARCDTELLERLGATEFSRVLAPIGLTLKQWRKIF